MALALQMNDDGYHRNEVDLTIHKECKTTVLFCFTLPISRPVKYICIPFFTRRAKDRKYIPTPSPKAWPSSMQI